MKQKTLIERNLSFSHTYVFEGITRGSIESAQFCSCDNCGKLITNMVHLTDTTDGKKYVIGTDCSDTIAEVGKMQERTSAGYQMGMYSFNKALRFITEFNKGLPVESIWDGMRFIIEKPLKSGKTTQVDIYRTDLEKWFPEVLKQIAA